MKNSMLCKHVLDLKDDKEVYEFLRKSFPDMDVKETKGSYLSFCISMLCYICYPLSISELVTMLGKYIGGTIARSRIVEMLDRGDLKTYEFDKDKDMNALHAYYLSASKKESLIRLLPDFFKDSDTKFRKSAGKVPLHDYGVGMSLLQVMLCRRPFLFQKEVGFTASNIYRKERGSLCVDAIVTMTDKNEKYYIEQDMGTERVSTLCGKLYAYEKYGLYRDRGALIFSCHVAMPYPKRECYNKTQLSFLLADMKEEMMEDICDYYECSKDILDKKKLGVLKDLMVTVGVAQVNGREAAGGGGDSSSGVTASTEISLTRGGGRFSISDLEDFIKSLSLGNNPYRLSEYNAEQKRRSTHKFRSMTEILCAYVRRGGMDRGEIRFITSAFPCMVYPTVLMSHCFDYLNMIKHDYKDIRKVLERYFGNMDSFMHNPNGVSLYLEDECFIYMNNVYKKDDVILCVEHIGCDVSAFVRFYYMYYLRECINQPVYLIGLGSRDDILYMSEQFDYSVEYGAALPDNGLFVSFLDEDNMDYLTVPFKRMDGEILLMELVSDIEEKKRKNAMDEYYRLSPEVRASMSKEEKAKFLGIS